MSGLIVTLLIIAFLGLLIMNVLFRARILKSYKKLIQNKVSFASKYVFNKNALKKEVLPQYSKGVQKDILNFVDNIHQSMKFAMIFLLLIIIFGVILVQIGY